MSHNVESDACIAHLDYRKLLIDVHENLVSRDLAALKFLCSDIMPVAVLERVTSGLELLDLLETRRYIVAADNVLFLAELLYYIGRKDLLRKLNVTDNEVRTSLTDKQHSHVKQHRVLLHTICQELTTKELLSLKFQCSAKITRAKLETIKTPQELILELERQRVITHDNFTYLLSLLRDIHRQDLVLKVSQFAGLDKSTGKQTNLPVNTTPEYKRLESDDCSLSPTNRVVSLQPAQVQEQWIDKGEVDQSRLVPCYDTGMVPGTLQQPGLVFSEDTRVVPGYNEDSTAELHRRLAVGERYVRQDDSLIMSQVPQNVELSRYLPVIIASGGSQPHASAGIDQLAIGQQLRLSTLHDVSIDDELPCYTMNRKPRGLCVIVNNEKFYKLDSDNDSKKMPDRTGTQIDCDHLQLVFESLQFKVEILNNLTHDELARGLLSAAGSDHSMYDCFVCCILSHGALGTVYGCDGKTVRVYDLMSYFKGASCPSLRGKPKIFFVQACQGTEKQQGFPADIETDSACAPSEVETIPNEADFLLGLATVPGYVSYRSKTQGSWYITTLVSMLSRYANRYDLLSILTRVNERVSEAFTKEGNLKQVPAPMFTLRKKLYFC
uniref:Caspase-8 n=1 Tax=Tubifex tubifex TaxID=6386 RepID=C3VPW4_TUBTU|nr:caspase 8 [Tubifex tubifex]